ncbi:MAG: DNA polymerase III subunit gamma/tau [Rubrivivax sp.]|jgi:DNA polymerase-3 subunit gamma/tau
MGYVVLARKYRPRNFSQMAGQDHVVRALTNALDQRRLHHAYLFTGTRGIGKTTISRILAKSLNCTGPDGSGDVTSSPCGQCAACTDIDTDRYVDYIEMDAASHGGKDEIRDLIERAAYKPALGRYKVFMIDEAHQLTKDAFNALLKTLEEPPEYLKFVLATTDPERMLPTVLSRCLQFNLRPMAPDVVQEHLAQVLASENIPAQGGALRLLSEAARGSMRDALSLTDQAIAYGGGQLTQETVAAMLGASHGQSCVDLLLALAHGDGPAVMQVARHMQQAGASSAAALDTMAGLLQRAAVEQVAPGTLADGSQATAEVAELAQKFAPEELQLAYSVAVHGKSELALMSDEHAALVMILLRILAFLDRPRTAMPARTAPLRAPAPPSLSVPARTVAPVCGSAVPWAPASTEPAAGDGSALGAAADLQALADRWNLVVRRLAEEGRVAGLIRELAWQGSLVALDEGPPAVWTLRTSHDSLRGNALRDKLAEALSASMQTEIRIEVQAGDGGDTPARRDAADKARRQTQAEAVIRDDPLVQSLLQQFSTARVVPGSIRPA